MKSLFKILGIFSIITSLVSCSKEKADEIFNQETKLTLTIIKNNQPAPNIDVYIFSEENAKDVSVPEKSKSAYREITNSEGIVNFKNIAPGRFYEKVTDKEKTFYIVIYGDNGSVLKKEAKLIKIAQKNSFTISL